MSNPTNLNINMSQIHSERLDLNLIKMFDAVMETRSVSRAAALLGVSQSAVSHALARLRDLIGDPLFIRTAGRMEPTPRAQRLAEPLRDLMLGAARALSAEETFDPRRDARSFRIAASDSIQTVLLSGLLTDAAAGLRVSLVLRSLDPDHALDGLDAGEVDLAIGFLPTSRRWHERQRLYAETHRCLFDPTLVPLSPPVGMEEFVRHPHIVPSLRGELSSFVDRALEERGLSRQVVASTTQFLAIPMLLKTAPMIATLPGRLARYCAAAAALTHSPLPFPSPDYEVSMVWHKRDNGSASHGWLRGRIAENAVAERLPAP